MFVIFFLRFQAVKKDLKHNVDDTEKTSESSYYSPFLQDFKSLYAN